MAKLGHYEVIKCIGSTEKTMLYAARHPYLGRDVVIEASPSSCDTDLQKRLKFLAQLLGTLDHSNILPVFDAFEDGKMMYLVFNWPSEKLKSVERIVKDGGQISIDQALIYTLHLCEVLEFLEQKGVVHQNIHLQNLLVSENDFYLSGFNLANKVTNSHEEYREELMDGRYAAPEWIARHPLTCKQDIWSLGVALYNMLTGKYPFEGDEELSTAQVIIGGEYKRLNNFPNIPQCLDELLQRIFVAEPEKRISVSEIKDIVSKELYKTPVGTVFIAMPFHMHFNRAYNAIKRVCQEHRLQPVRVDENFMPANIWQEIEEGINKANFIIGDLSPVPGFEQTNPNVAFEVGIAHHLQKPTVLLTQDIEKLPFDFKQQRVNAYANTEEGMVELEKKLHDIIKSIMSSN
ncbi:serine/threonine protein kinase [Candidatus Uabimicrobium amorphum]|uniref:Serine/threonine protein kinase n=1 Tax=Uabimicrobium amorphum TaxID=2596890 RepID=A0A5S9IVX2_UABAM|nr:serine/threonine-protein kinase [Candidatus Uabimicrobium amorphum]BBM87525.1 serine/threonine protein kinase [Candidatus Uabimicrobium amorphum]